MRKAARFCLAAVCLAGSAFAQDVIRPGELARGSAPQPVTPAANRYIVRFTAGTSQAARANAAFLAGATVRHNYAGIEAIAVSVPNANALDGLRRNPQVTRIVPDFIVRSQQKTDRNAKGGGGGGGTTLLDFDTRQVISTEVQRAGSQ